MVNNTAIHLGAPQAIVGWFRAPGGSLPAGWTVC